MQRGTTQPACPAPAWNRLQGVVYSHRSNFLHAFAICLPDTMGLGSSSSVLAVVPMFHVSCWGG